MAMDMKSNFPFNKFPGIKITRTMRSFHRHNNIFILDFIFQIRP